VLILMKLSVNFSQERESQIKKIVLTIFSLIFIALIGCATPAGKISKSDFVWQEKVIEANYQEVYNRIVNGFRTCGDLIAEGNLYTDAQKGHFDIYLRDPLGGRSDWVIGIINLKPDNKGNTIVKVGVQTIYNGPLFGEHGKYRRLWLRFAEGDLSCKP
jgi:hypothetical protein